MKRPEKGGEINGRAKAKRLGHGFAVENLAGGGGEKKKGPGPGKRGRGERRS